MLPGTLKKRVAAHFGKAAHTYDVAARLQKRVAARTMMLLPPQKGALSILDLGSGTGYQTKLLSQRYPGAMVVGTDLSEGMVNYARSCEHYESNHCWSVGDIENLPFRRCSFDLVYSSLAIQWCDLRTVAKEVMRILKPGGSFVFSSLASGTMHELDTAWQAVDEGMHTNSFLSFAEQKHRLTTESLKLNAWHAQTETLFYPDVKSLLRELKALGVNTVCSPNKGLMTRKKLEALCDAYESFRREEGLPLSYNVVYGQLGVDR